MKRRPQKPAAGPRLEELLAENASLRRELLILRALAYRDSLTGLWNRRFFEERLNEEITRANRTPGRSFTVMAVDVDGIKQVNDSQGHAAGDRLLIWVGRFLRSATRAHDVCCRTGGDEFAVLLPDLERSGSTALLARLRQSLSELNARGRSSVGLSFGTASFPEDAATQEHLVARADAAMYRDKRRRKGAEEPTPPPRTHVTHLFES